MLWLSPWMRPLARVYVESLRALDFDVVLVTSNNHPESDAARDYEWVLNPRPHHLETWRPYFAALRRARKFHPDVVITEIVLDPRWIAFAGLAPRVNLVHDDRPHDASEERPLWDRAVFDTWNARAKRTVSFSSYVADAVGADAVVPLTSDLDPHRVPPFVPAADRHDFVLVGRLNEYKNLDVIFRAWQRHVSGPGWQGDDLVLIGDGTMPIEPGEHVRWIKGKYSYDDVIAPMSAAKGSLVHYRVATQSGVQVLAMQLGVAPIVSDQGALPEFQPAGEPALPVDDVDALTRVFDELADPEEAARRGAIAEKEFQRRFAVDVAGPVLGRVLDGVIAEYPGNRLFGRRS
ncbi:glycosyltransferase family 4 protein [Skermania piniformis]|uniref:Glycosyltransferase family 4 protein n=1 Tax=Skermania pinensis TaxID=39122 RepID=A0ABX8SDU0_9ACTN|nr:glycosyltransferase family 4 protein [Skermania piniformis]